MSEVMIVCGWTEAIVIVRCERCRLPILEGEQFCADCREWLRSWNKRGQNHSRTGTVQEMSLPASRPSDERVTGFDLVNSDGSFVARIGSDERVPESEEPR